MSFTTYEKSIRSGVPVELFEIQVGSTIFYYTTHPVDVVHNLITYTSIMLKSGSYSASNDLKKSDITITTDRESPLADFVSIYTPSIVILLTIKRLHLSDPADQSIVTWQGRILSFLWKGHLLEIKAESILTSIGRTGLVRTYSENCPFNLFDSNCRRTSGPYTLSTTLISVNNNILVIGSVSGNPDQYYRGGYVEINLGGGILERRTILDQTGTTLTVSYEFSDLSAITNIIILPGCDKTVNTCLNKYSNLDNYGGFPYIPTFNPFTTTIF